MEVFRYMTEAEYARIGETGALSPGEKDPSYWVVAEGISCKPIYGLPDDPLVWGVERTRNLLGWIRYISGNQEPSILIRFMVDEENLSSRIHVQDESLDRPEQAQTRVHVSRYKPGLFVRPEVLLEDPILREHITLVEFPQVLR